MAHADGHDVLRPGSSPDPSLHIYAHCLRGKSGGVALLAINTDRNAAHSLELPIAAERYTLTAKNLLDKRVRLNGTELKLGPDDALPEMTGVATNSGQLTFEPATITFLAISDAGNASCR